VLISVHNARIAHTSAVHTCVVIGADTQAAECLQEMSRLEIQLRTCSLTLPFHLLEMPTAAAGAEMEFFGVGVKPSLLYKQKQQVSEHSDIVL
jgi:DNA polymerase I-like protein with 3'-5' exonuclease and polymerase domains